MIEAHSHQPSRGSDGVIIDLKSYREWARTKRPLALSERDNLLDAALGLAGESMEFLDVTRGDGFPHVRRILDEAGDVLFYAAWLVDACLLLGISVPKGVGEKMFPSHLHLPPGKGSRDPDVRAVVRFGRAVEAVKKHVFHGRDLDGIIYDHAYWGLVSLHRDLVLHGTRLDIALQLNIEKLDVRYPEGFVAVGGRDGGGVS